jgi:hypothetical protein
MRMAANEIARAITSVNMRRVREQRQAPGHESADNFGDHVGRCQAKRDPKVAFAFGARSAMTVSRTHGLSNGTSGAHPPRVLTPEHIRARRWLGAWQRQPQAV